MEENRTKSYNRKQKSVDSEVRKFVNPEVRKFEGELRPLMSEAEKSEAQVLDLSYDFACRIIRLYKYLNEVTRDRYLSPLQSLNQSSANSC